MDVRNANMRPPAITRSDSGSSSQHAEDSRKLAHSISQKFKTPMDHFHGKTGEDITEFFKMYDIASVDYQLSYELKFQFLHNLFDGEARRFYLDKIAPFNSIYTEVKKKMIDQYNNSTTQNRMRQYLQNLKLSTIMEKESCDVTTGIEKLRDTVNKYTPLGPESHRTDSSKIEYIYDAVVEHEWASSALTNCYTATPP